jgi:hypothetical protein
MAKRKRPEAEPDLLKGWQQIAAFLGQPVSVAQRWANDGMPSQKTRTVRRDDTGGIESQYADICVNETKIHFTGLLANAGSGAGIVVVSIK